MAEAAFRLRRATAADLDTVVDLRLKMQAELIDSDEEARRRVRAANVEYFRATLGSNGMIAVLAEAGSEAVGAGVLVLFDKPPSHLPDVGGREGYILNMYTEPAWRRRGIAGAIVEHLLAAAREAGAALVWLRASDMGRPVYAKRGFTENPHYMQLWIAD